MAQGGHEVDEHEHDQSIVLPLVDQAGRTPVFGLPSTWRTFSVGLLWFCSNEAERGAFNVHLEYGSADVGDRVVPTGQEMARITVESGRAHVLERDVIAAELPWTGIVGSLRVVVDKSGADPYTGLRADLVLVAVQLVRVS